MSSLQSKVADLLQVAKYAPSGGNLQPWKVYMIADEETLQSKRIKLIVAIDEQMEIGQYADLGAFIQNIRLLCPEHQLAVASPIRFFDVDSHGMDATTQPYRELFNIPRHELIFCEMELKQAPHSKL
mmetsp:Transcript_22236/g.35647  ORF Transcript_22236/g.35647 Transcript_22236/m.35647 type:complete len:127 (+) Transcript_22236:33-413(+)